MRLVRGSSAFLVLAVVSRLRIFEWDGNSLQYHRNDALFSCNSLMLIHGVLRILTTVGNLLCLLESSRFLRAITSFVVDCPELLLSATNFQNHFLLFDRSAARIFVRAAVLSCLSNALPSFPGVKTALLRLLTCLFATAKRIQLQM